MRILSSAEALGVAGGLEQLEEVTAWGQRFAPWPSQLDIYQEELRRSLGMGTGIDWRVAQLQALGFTEDPSDAGGGGDLPPPVPDSATMAAWDVTEWTEFFAKFTKDWSKLKASAFAAALASMSQHPVCKVVGVGDYLKAMAIWIPTGDPFWMASETRNELSEWPKDKREIFINLVVEALGVIKDAGVGPPRGI